VLGGQCLRTRSCVRPGCEAVDPNWTDHEWDGDFRPESETSCVRIRKCVNCGGEVHHEPRDADHLWDPAPDAATRTCRRCGHRIVPPVSDPVRDAPRAP
jgi:DNA-directed RNA polymerase subunit RPC12/RpoP